MKAIQDDALLRKLGVEPLQTVCVDTNPRLAPFSDHCLPDADTDRVASDASLVGLDYEFCVDAAGFLRSKDVMSME